MEFWSFRSGLRTGLVAEPSVSVRLMKRRNLENSEVIVPRNGKPLVAVSAGRVQRLREHLIGILQDLRKASHLERFASPLRPAAGRASAALVVAVRPASLCEGWCCRNGDDDAFLDDRTLARVRLARPDATENAPLLRLYLSPRAGA